MSLSTTMFLKCRWCRGKLWTEGRCWRCGTPSSAPVSLSTMAPAGARLDYDWTLQPSRTLDDGEPWTLSVAWYLSRRRPTLDDGRGRLAFEDEVSIQVFTGDGWEPSIRRNQGLDVAPSAEHDDVYGYGFDLQQEVPAAKTLDEVAVWTERVLLLVALALDAGDDVTSIDVYDAGQNLFGVCKCGAWPSQRHFDDECGLDALGDRRIYWGRWREHERELVLPLVGRVLGDVAELFDNFPRDDYTAPDTTDHDGLYAPLGTALVPERQVEGLLRAQRRLALGLEARALLPAPPQLDLFAGRAA